MTSGNVTSQPSYWVPSTLGPNDTTGWPELPVLLGGGEMTPRPETEWPAPGT